MWLPLLLPTLAGTAASGRAEVVAPPVDPEAAAAEARRLSQDIRQLAAREAWVGVERKFQELAALGVPLSYEDWWRGAQAARALGRVDEVYTRLQAAAALDPTREALDWLYAIDSNYGHVSLRAEPPRGVGLVVAEMPFDPDARLAVEWAVAEVGRAAAFEGLLPRGRYDFAAHPFVVEPGVSVQIDVNLRRRRAPSEPTPAAVAAPPQEKQE